jgi:hypothetical protein
VRGNIIDEPTHIHFDTGNNQYYNQFIGDDNKYIQLANTGNIVINTNNYAGNTAQWNFDTDGVLTLPAGSSQITSYGQITIETDNNASGMYLNANGVNLLYANANVTLRANSTGTNKDWDFSTSGNLSAPGNVSAVGNVTGGNILTGGLISATGNVIAGNVSTGIITLTNGAVIKDTTGESVAFGQGAGNTTQGQQAVAIGLQAGFASQGNYAVAIGKFSANSSQGEYAVAVGPNAGFENQLANAVAIGFTAGASSQGINSVAVGVGAAYNTQGNSAVAVGNSAGYLLQGLNSVSIGDNAGFAFQGVNSVAVGRLAGNTNQANNSIILNATGAALDQTTANTFTVAPIRNDVANVAQVMFYNTTSKEITYGNTISVAGNVTGANILTAGIVSATGNITGNYILGNGSQLTGLPATYGNANVATFLAAYGSNTISTSGNITAGNIIGNISITGNVTGTSSNVTLVAGAYSWTFDNTGNLQGNLSLTGANITINNAPGGSEGAEIKWALPSPANTVLNTSLVQDVFQNGMRFFESGGNSRGLYMDLGNVPNGAGTAVGYRDIPQVSFTANTTIATTDAGRHYYSTLSTGNVLTIANNASQGFQIGAAISIINQGSGNITVAQGSGVTLYLAGNATSGNRTVATFGMATLIKVATDTWFINGTGVT